MKKWPFAALLAAQILVANSSFADDQQKPEADSSAVETQALLKEIPTTEKEFVDAINKYDKVKIIEQLGEPAKADDIKLKDSGKIVASIWHYHYLNTAEDGTYYQTTELDFIDGKVVMVVFLNNDGSEGPANGQKYDLPAGKPDM